MSPEAKKSLWAAAGTILCAGAVVGGVVLRDVVDLGGSLGRRPSNLLASNSNASATSLPEITFFQDMKELLERKFVDPIRDEGKLADGAVRGMVASLGDAHALYMDRDQYRVYSAVREGRYEGIGADLVLTSDRPDAKLQIGSADDDTEDRRLPTLLVAAVVPGSPADKAGLKPGDWIEFVDGRWIPNSEALDAFQRMHDAVKTGAATPQQYMDMRKSLRDEAEKNVLPIRARDRLMMGTSGSVEVQWFHGSKRMKATCAKGVWQMPGLGLQADGSIRLPFVPGSAAKLRELLNGKSEAVLDLRNNVDGDLDEMLACLREVAPKGVYGYLATERPERPQPLTVTEGRTQPLNLKLIVDRTTRGTAEVFAIALSSRGVAKLIGSETAGDEKVVQWYRLPDGAGYTLTTAEYKPEKPSETIVAQRTPKTGVVAK